MGKSSYEEIVTNRESYLITVIAKIFGFNELWGWPPGVALSILWIPRVNLDAYISLLKHTRQLLLVTFCDTTAEIGASFWMNVGAGWMEEEGRTDRRESWNIFFKKSLILYNTIVSSCRFEKSRGKLYWSRIKAIGSLRGIWNWYNSMWSSYRLKKTWGELTLKSYKSYRNKRRLIDNEWWLCVSWNLIHLTLAVPFVIVTHYNTKKSVVTIREFHAFYELTQKRW